MVRRAKKIICNPVLEIPWIPRRLEIIASCTPYSFEDIILNLKTDHDPEDLSVPKNVRYRPRRVTKATITRIYADQLAPLYPQLTKTHVKAALTLSDNNMHESRVLLDLKNKCLQMRRNISLPILPRGSSSANKENESGNAKAEDETPNVSNKSSSTVTLASGSSTPTTYLSTSISSRDASGVSQDNGHSTPSESDTNPVSSGNLSAASNSSTITIDSNNLSISSNDTPIALQDSNRNSKLSTFGRNVASSVYDFNETTSETESVKNWFNHKRENMKRTLTARKVGVIIIRCQNGYKSCLL